MKMFSKRAWVLFGIVAVAAVAAVAAVGAYAYFTTVGFGLSLPLLARVVSGLSFKFSVLLLVSAVLVRASVAEAGGRGHAGLGGLRASSYVLQDSTRASVPGVREVSPWLT
jgi:uncharacterized membrane protein